ncbi:hypothetical protein CWO84_09810 [Methylomonas sp. Kb3]|nr:hypothetical protein CWO84_09810 [Methylomonas sp. Kb3]
MSELDAELNVEYRRILDSHPKDRFPKENELLVEAQRAWIRYRDKVCDFEDQAIGGAYSISLMRCKARITENRLNEFIQIYGDKI